MDHLFDEFSKSLAESVPRRESLRRLGAVFAGAVLTPVGLGTAWAGRNQRRVPDPCTTFCNQRCPKSRRPNCLVWCRACNNDPSRLCGDCWSGLRCCGTGETCCHNHTCHDLENDFVHCGACGNSCAAPGPYEVGACIDRRCEYWCVEGAVVCNGACSLLDSDPDNCGACGNVCPEGAPYCIGGACSECPPGLELCRNSCVNVERDPDNCGACGNVCPDSAPACSNGTCSECGIFQTNCGGYCAYLLSDPNNCGACGFVCLGGSCSSGECDYGAPGE